MKVGDYVKVVKGSMRKIIDSVCQINDIDEDGDVRVFYMGTFYWIPKSFVEVFSEANDNPFNTGSCAQKDEVNHPEHYTSGKYETIDIIKDSVDDFKSYVHGNIIKYILRYKRKGGVQDLKKAQIYLSWLIQEEECKHL